MKHKKTIRKKISRTKLTNVLQLPNFRKGLSKSQINKILPKPKARKKMTLEKPSTFFVSKPKKSKTRKKKIQRLK